MLPLLVGVLLGTIWSLTSMVIDLTPIPVPVAVGASAFWGALMIDTLRRACL